MKRQLLLPIGFIAVLTVGFVHQSLAGEGIRQETEVVAFLPAGDVGGGRNYPDGSGREHRVRAHLGEVHG